jgi:hypothetical protein
MANGMRAYGKGVWSGRRGAGVNAPGGNSFSGRNGGKRAVLRGEHVISRKAIAQGMSDALRCPVCSCAHFFYPLHMRPRVQRAPGIPCALCFREVAKITRKPRAHRAARTRRCILRHCERSDLSAEALAKAEAIHRAAQRKNGLLRGAYHRARIRATRWLAMTRIGRGILDDERSGADRTR